MDVLLIRHAESANNALWARDPDAFTSERTHDPPLTDLGFEQADTLARHLAARGARIDRLVASPMLRAIQTARPVAAALGVPLEIWVEVHERGGIYVGDPRTGEGFVAHPGLSRSAIDELVPGARVPDAVDDEGWWRDGHETDDVFAVRAGDAFARLIDESGRHAEDDVIAVVTHGDFANALLGAAVGAPAGRVYFNHVNTGLTRLRLRADGRVSLGYVNRTPHLDGARPLQDAPMPPV
jgi:broad specificity phosphatase PhoE